MIEAIPGGGTIRKNVAKELANIPAYQTHKSSNLRN